MQQLTHLAGIQTSACMQQQQTEADDYSSVSPQSDFNSAFARAKQGILATEVTHPERYEAIQTALYGGLTEPPRAEKTADEVLCRTRDELRQLSMQLLTIQERERQRIAADLHDGIGQSLSLIQLSLEAVMQQINCGEQQAAVESLQQLTYKVKATMGELHRTTMDMRPSMLDDLGIVPTLSWFFREFELAWRGRELEKNVSIAESDVPVPLKTTIFRILQEAMNNIVKHANADKIWVSLKKVGDVLQLSIEDNGHGFDPNTVSAQHGAERGFGLLTMQERARSSEGIFEMKSNLQQGTRILIAWRLKEAAAEQLAAKFPLVKKLARANSR